MTTIPHTTVILDKVETMLRDQSFEHDSSTKLRHYAKEHPDLVEYHPILLVYCCASKPNLDECIRLIATLSEFSNVEMTQPGSADIMQAIDFVVESSPSTPIIKIIIDCENRFLDTIKSIPVLFMKACIDRNTFMKSAENHVEARQDSIG